MTKSVEPTLNLRYAARSDVGLVRSNNEDSGYAGAHMLVVADGMGGHAAGELASSTAIATFAELDLAPPGNEALTALAEATAHTYRELSKLMQENPDFRGMGTTVTAVSWEGDRVAIAHIGDSRAYLLRQNELVQITKDHTYVQTLVDAGEITADQAHVHPKRNLLLKALDGIHPADPDLSIRQVKAGDRFLLCSDGLSGVVTDAEIAASLRQGDPTGAVMSLVEKAIAGGAPDNVTCVVADLVIGDDNATIAKAINSAALGSGSDSELEENLNNTLAIPVQTNNPAPVVVGAAGELRNRHRLPGLAFPDDSEPDPENPDRKPANPSQHQDQSSGEGEVPAPPPRRRVSRFIPALTALLLIAVALFGLGMWVSNQYYVTDFEGRIAIYQGIPVGIGDKTFANVIQTSETRVDQLPTYSQEKVHQTIHSNDGLEGARKIVISLEQQAKICETKPHTSGCPAPAKSPLDNDVNPTPTPGSPQAALVPGAAALVPGATVVGAPQSVVGGVS